MNRRLALQTEGKVGIEDVRSLNTQEGHPVTLDRNEVNAFVTLGNGYILRIPWELIEELHTISVIEKL